MQTRSPALNIMVAAARKAGRSLIRDFNEIENLQTKTDNALGFVEVAKRRCEKVLSAELSLAHSDYGYLSTSVDRRGTESSRWLIDPLGSQDDFLHALPHIAMTIALERRGDVIAALIYAPISDDIFVAEKGGGAFHNSRKLRVSGRRHLNEAMIGCAPPRPGSTMNKIINALAAAGVGVRTIGTPALDLAWFAAGKYDAILRDDLNPSIYAAGSLTIREAGGLLLDIDSHTSTDAEPSLIATTLVLQRQILEIIRNT